MKKAFLSILIVIFLVPQAHAFQKTVEAKSISSGIYEDGKFTPRSDSFTAVYTIDDIRDKIVLDKIIDNNREGRYEEGTQYEITNALESEGPSALLVSRDKKGQEILTAVRDSGLGASETMIVGKNFYQYSKAENGKFYLEYGKVTEKSGY